MLLEKPTFGQQVFLTCDCCSDAKRKPESIGVKLLKTYLGTDSDPDPECLNRRISNFEAPVRSAFFFCGSTFVIRQSVELRGGSDLSGFNPSMIGGRILNEMRFSIEFEDLNKITLLLPFLTYQC